MGRDSEKVNVIDSFWFPEEENTSIRILEGVSYKKIGDGQNRNAESEIMEVTSYWCERTKI